MNSTDNDMFRAASPASLTRRRLLSAAVTLAALPLPALAAQEAPGAAEPLRPILPLRETPLFNGRDLTGWYTFLPSQGRDKDPEHIFSVEDGVIHVTGKEFGYFATMEPYANYRLRFEVRWGEKRWPPRETQVRDSGCLLHVVGTDKVWPTCFECQIQENDFGDIFHLGGVSSLKEGKRVSGRVVRREMREKPRGEWNTVEVICDNDTIVHIVNGSEVNRAEGVARGGNGRGGPLNAGRIAFQSEGAEIFYRNITIAPVR